MTTRKKQDKPAVKAAPATKRRPKAPEIPFGGKRKPEPKVYEQVADTPEGLAKGWAEKLSPREQLFVAAYLANGMNATAAAIEAGYAEKSAGHLGHRLTKKVHVAGVISKALSARRDSLGVKGDDVIRRFWELATANPQAISQTRRVCCKYCHGEDHQKQFTPSEYAAAKKDHEIERAILLKNSEYDIGEFRDHGVWYDKRKEPNPDCPECFGEGIEEVWIGDSRKLSPQDALLFEAAKMGKNGIEVSVTKRVDALDKVARGLGVYRELEDEKPAGEVAADALDKLFGGAMERARQRQEEARSGRDGEGFDGT